MVERAARLTNGKIGVSVIPDGVSADRLVDGTNNKVFTSAEKTKLAGVGTNGNSINVQESPNNINLLLISNGSGSNAIRQNPDNADSLLVSSAASSGSTNSQNSRIVYADAPPANSGLVAVSADNTTDDTSKIQAALDYISSHYLGGALILPPKTLKCSAGINIPAGVTLRGDANKTILNFSSMNVNSTAVTSTGNNTFPLESIKLQGPNGSDKNNYPSNTCIGVLLAGIGITIKNVSIVGFSCGLDLSNNDTFFFLGENVTIGNSNVCVNMNQSAASNGGSILSENGERMVFQDCILFNSKIGIDADGSGIDAFFIGCSLDYLGVHGKIADSFVHLIGCHLETGYAANNNNWGSINRYLFDMSYTARLSLNNCRMEVRDTGVYSLVTPDTGPSNYNEGYLRLDGTNTWYGSLPTETRQFNDRDMRYFSSSENNKKFYSPFASKWSPISARYVANDGTVEPANHRARISAMSVSTVGGTPPEYSITITRELFNSATPADGWIEIKY